ncbi:MAG: hypothetical protein QNI91_11695, partial [Arenicellales bacterium]|nr:hypothetical protein [Arenicellales bacterium]
MNEDTKSAGKPNAKGGDSKQEHPKEPSSIGTSKERDPVDRYTKILLIIVAVLFVWYVAADRLAPWTDQARIDGFVVPITPKVSGKVKKVLV